jgi:aminocarboxymuconate-semialdehyde decarboxylase
MGSDAPFPLGEPDPVNFVRNSLRPDIAEMVLKGNYARIFGN